MFRSNAVTLLKWDLEFEFSAPLLRPSPVVQFSVKGSWLTYLVGTRYIVYRPTQRTAASFSVWVLEDEGGQCPKHWLLSPSNLQLIVKT